MYDYKIIRSNRKTIALQINEKGEIIVRSPQKTSVKKLNEFVLSNSEWIEKSLDKIEKRNLYKCELSDDDIFKLKKLAKSVIPEKVEKYSQIMNVKPTGIKITSAQKRFGSCSASNSLCFSYMLMLYPEKAIDYVVIHELAHIRHHNHSRDFYNFVSMIMPDYKSAEKLLSLEQNLPY